MSEVINVQNGQYALFSLQGFQSTPWANDQTKFNHRLTLVSHMTDNFGNPQTNYTNVDINPEDVTRIQTFANQNSGKQVFIPIICQARKGGRDGAWLSTRMPKGAIPHVFSEFVDSLVS